MPESRLTFPTTKGFRMKISMKLVYQYMAIFFIISLTSSHLYPPQVENCDSNSRLVVDEDDNDKFRLVSVKREVLIILTQSFSSVLHQNQPPQSIPDPNYQVISVVNLDFIFSLWTSPCSGKWFLSFRGSTRVHGRQKGQIKPGLPKCQPISKLQINLIWGSQL